MIVHKLIAGRLHDLDDIRQILAADVVLDAAYIEEWAARWDVLARWRAILAEDRAAW